MIVILLFALLITVSHQAPIRANLFKPPIEKKVKIPEGTAVDPPKTFESINNELQELKERIKKIEKINVTRSFI